VKSDYFERLKINCFKSATAAQQNYVNQNDIENNYGKSKTLQMRSG
jgi:hypothetical protein